MRYINFIDLKELINIKIQLKYLCIDILYFYELNNALNVFLCYYYNI